MTIVIGFNPVEYQNEDRVRAQEVAISVIANAPHDIVPLALDFYDESKKSIVKKTGVRSLNLLKRDSQKEIGNTRKLPYIKEMIDVLCMVDCEKFGIMNSDILMNDQVFSLLRQDKDAYMFPRYEIKDLDFEDFINGKIDIVYEKHPGNDAFFFKKDWWLSNRDKFNNDLILGEADWDNYYRDMIRKCSNNYIEQRAIYHVQHKEGWLFKSSGQINNGKIWLDLWEKTLKKETVVEQKPRLTPEQQEKWRQWERDRNEKMEKERIAYLEKLEKFKRKK